MMWPTFPMQPSDFVVKPTGYQIAFARLGRIDVMTGRMSSHSWQSTIFSNRRVDR